MEDKNQMSEDLHLQKFACWNHHSLYLKDALKQPEQSTVKFIYNSNKRSWINSYPISCTLWKVLRSETPWIWKSSFAILLTPSLCILTEYIPKKDWRYPNKIQKLVRKHYSNDWKFILLASNTLFNCVIIRAKNQQLHISITMAMQKVAWHHFSKGWL